MNNGVLWMLAGLVVGYGFGRASAPVNTNVTVPLTGQALGGGFLAILDGFRVGPASLGIAATPNPSGQQQSSTGASLGVPSTVWGN